MNNQLPRIIEILERDGQIDNFYCLHNHLSNRLAARINDLKALGYEFRTERREDKNFVYILTRQPELTLFA